MNSDFRYIRGIAEYYKQNYSAATSYFTNAIARDPHNAELYYSRGVSSGLLEDNLASIKDFDKSIELGANWPRIYSNRGIDKVILGDLPGSLADFNKAIELCHNHFLDYFYRGYIEYRLCNYAKSIEDFNKSIELEPVHNQSYFYRAKSKKYLNDYIGFQEDLVMDSKCDDYISSCCYEQRGLYKLKLCKYHEAIEAFTKCILRGSHTTIDHIDIVYYLLRGFCKIYLKDYSAATEDFNNALRIDPRFVKIFSAHYFILWDSHNYPGAEALVSQIDSSPFKRFYDINAQKRP